MNTTHRLIAAALAVPALVVTLAACSTSDEPAAPRTSTPSAAATSRPVTTGPATAPATTVSPAPAATSATTTAAAANDTPVHVSLYNLDGSRYGVGMPVIAYFSRRITDAAQFQRATSVTADGKPLAAAWYFEDSGTPGSPIEAHLRPETYWPAHADIHVALPVKAVSAGKGLAFENNLTLDFTTGARIVAKVSDRKHMLTLTKDGERVGRFPVSLGGPGSRTLNGTKVVMEQDEDTRMQGEHGGVEYDLDHVYWTQRLTYGGEYLHAAPWNVPSRGGDIGSGDSSNGCTNLSTDDARTLYRTMRPGDVVLYPDTTGPKMTLADGFGDWNVSWAKWRTGGLVPTT